MFGHACLGEYILQFLYLLYAGGRAAALPRPHFFANTAPVSCYINAKFGNVFISGMNLEMKIAVAPAGGMGISPKPEKVLSKNGVMAV